MNNIIFILSLILLILHSVASVTIYVGTESGSIYVIEFDASNGKLELKQSVNVGNNPSFLAVHPGKQYLYSVNEVEYFNGKSNSGGLSSFRIGSGGGLTLLNSVTSNGGSPAHLTLDKSGKWLLAANYNGGNYGVWEITSNGAIGANPVSFFQDTGKGTNPSRQDKPHAHQIVPDKSNSFVVVPDLGIDKWMQYSFDEKSGKLTPSGTPFLQAPSGTGPRHIEFHPTLPYAYGVGELLSTMTVFSVDNSRKNLTPKQVINLTPSPNDQTTAAEVQISSDGKFVYGSNRPNGRNGTIACFSVESSSGQLTNIGYAETYGQTPRYFGLSPSGEFVLVANQNSNNIVVLKRDKSTGMIGREVVSKLDNISQPSHILFL